MTGTPWTPPRWEHVMIVEPAGSATRKPAPKSATGEPFVSTAERIAVAEAQLRTVQRRAARVLEAANQWAVDHAQDRQSSEPAEDARPRRDVLDVTTRPVEPDDPDWLIDQWRDGWRET